LIERIFVRKHFWLITYFEDKRHLVKIIFNGMLIYGKDEYQTTNLNSIAAITYLKNKELQRQKKGEKYL